MSSSLFAQNQSTFRFAEIILPLNLPQTLTYGVPHEMQEFLKPGMRVEVALGNNKQYSGIVERLHNNPPKDFQVKPIKSILDEEPIVNQKQLQFWKWIANYYIAAPGEVMQSALPAHLKLSGETRLLWAPEHEDVVYEWSMPAQLAVELLEKRRELALTELRNIVGPRNFSSVLNELLENETVIIDDSLESSYRPKKEKVISLAPAYKEEALMVQLFDELKRAPKQLELLMTFIQLSMKQPYVRQVDLLERTDASNSQIKALADKGVLIVEEVAVDRLQYAGDNENREIVFTPAQQAAYDELEKGLTEKGVALLEGVTGSGKTLLYIHKIKECIAQGRQALFLLPEIALTTQLVSRLNAYFGEELGVYHSRFSNNERVEIWEKVQNGKYKVVVGARSALWLPYNDLGLIVVDEEHDASYKQKDPAPRFHARDAAIYMAHLHNAKVILGSATPSAESIFNAKQGKFAYVRLTERYQGVRLPEIQIINATSLNLVRQQGIHLLTPELQQAIADALTKKKQVILFQNRRGYTPSQMCSVCGWVPQCRNCAVSLTYHKASDKLHCHYCGITSPVLHICKSCGSNRLTSKSFGTEKIEEEVQTLFPKARVARMDIDSMRGKESLTQLLDKLAKQKIDVLVGTQMVVKGLDFAPVALVGILSADSLLSFPDFRVNERAFQLMEQVSGRAGRADGLGKVIIQAYNTQHPVLHWVQNHDISTYYENEIQYREIFSYPPFSRLIKIIIRHKEESRAQQAAMSMAQSLQTVEGIIVQGPAPALISRVRNQYIQEIWVKCPRDTRLLENLKNYIKDLRLHIISQRGNSGLVIIPDVDPVS